MEKPTTNPLLNNDEKDKQELIFKEEVYKIIGAAIEIHKELGNGFLEAVYEEAMKLEGVRRNIPLEFQVRLPIYYKGILLERSYTADCIAFGKIIVEFKCIPKLTSVEEAQILHYLKATGLKVGLLINFGSPNRLEWKRYIF